METLEAVRRLFELLEDSDRQLAAMTVEGWGYPREITDWEVEYAVWLAYGKDVMFWFTPMPDSPDLAAHICISPAARGRVDARRLLGRMETISELLGAFKMWSVRPNDMAPEMTGYLKRLGFAKEKGGMVRLLGDESWVS